MEGKGLVKGLRRETLVNSAGRHGVRGQEQSCTDYQLAKVGKSQIQEYRYRGYLKGKEQAARYGVRIKGYLAVASKSEDDQKQKRQRIMKEGNCRGTWVTQSIRHLPSAQFMISGSWDRAPCRAPCLEAVGSLLLLLPLLLPSTLAVSLSLSNK